MIIIGFDRSADSFLTASGHVSDDWVLDCIFGIEAQEFDICFSSVALSAAVVRFSELHLQEFKEEIKL